MSVIVSLSILAFGGASALSEDAADARDLAAVLLGPAPAAFSNDQLSRVISARVRHTRLRPVRRSNARRIGRSLASLRPTWVTGTLRYARNQYPKRNEIRVWEEIRRIVRHQNPGAQFDVVLNALHYRTPAAVSRTMRRLRAKLSPEGWFFDFFSSGFHQHPRMVKSAIADAHAHGEWVGGNVFGLAKRRKLPARADFYSVQDHIFHLNLPAVRRLSAQKPVLYHLHSNPHRPRSGGCRFILRFNPKQRKSLIRRRAAQQARYGFRVSYPVLFPQCLRDRPNGPGTFLYAYNAFRDPPVRKEITRQLDRNDFDPAS
jgi:hypothetical protein